ncbi:MAG: TerC family protein [Chloroflexota bacterium]|nr:MAG: TerC family protein [Chloroflexota bacterium]
MEWLNAEGLVALVTLIALELVLGVDNIIFISILASKLPKEQQARARTVGIALAVITRIMLLLSLSFIAKLTQPIVTIAGFEMSGRDIILLVGGLFLIFKSVQEIHQKLEGEEGHTSKRVAATFNAVIFQIILLDIVFSLDSVITAVGMVNEIAIMVIAVIVAAAVMIFAAGPISKFVDERPTIKMLALSFLLLIGFTLAIEAFDVHVPKGYIYFAMGFSVFVEILNLRLRGKAEHPVKLRDAIVPEKPGAQAASATE